MSESKNYKVYEAGNAFRIVLPYELARQANIKDGDSITWTLDRDQLIVRKARDQGFRADIDKAIRER